MRPAAETVGVVGVVAAMTVGGGSATPRLAAETPEGLGFRVWC